MAAAAVLSSCSSESIVPEHGADGTSDALELVPLSISTGCQTKTTLNGTSVHWTSDDQIAVFDDLNYLNKFDAVSVMNSSAVFEGKVAARTTDFYAVYPYEGAMRADDYNIYVTLPAEQKASEGSFADDLNISIAHGTKAVEADEADGLVFENSCALLKFRIPSMFTSIVQASFTADSRPLAGNVIYSKEDGKIVGVIDDASGTNTVTVRGDLKGGETYYFVVSPGEVSGFTLEVLDATGVRLTNRSEKSFEAKAGVIRDLGEVKITVDPKVRVEHIYSGGNHVRTDVWVEHGLPSGMEKYIETIEGWMLPNYVRTVIMDGSKGTVKSPYLANVVSKTCLPEGYYTMHLDYRITGMGIISRDIGVYVPAP